MINITLNTKQVSCMTKVFADSEPAADWQTESVLQQEPFYAQLAWYCPQDLTLLDEFMHVKVQGSVPEVQVCTVESVPCHLPCYKNDVQVLRRAPGLFPDILQPIAQNGVFLLGGQWQSLWLEAQTENLTPGAHHITIELWHADKLLASHTYDFTVLPLALAPQPLLITQWMHYDCLAQHYGVETMSAEHWAIVWDYVDCAVLHGMNMLLVPLVTPPLDTLPGRERPTMQLVDICLENDAYCFDFTRLIDFLHTAQKHGIKAFEMTPMFTQWGAAFAPKVVAQTESGLQQIFGWGTAADSPEYTAFLRELLPQLAEVLRKENLQNCCYFHVSDEPQQPEHYPYYEKAYHLMRNCLPGFTIMDTLGSVEFYNTGAVDVPIVATDVYAEMQAVGAKNLWAYYCCAQYQGVANHFIAYSGARTRSIGTQMFATKAKGFLHWGFNFWNSKYSATQINPYAITDSGKAFPAGDPFVVYPGADGKPVCSLRLKLLRKAWCDYRALCLAQTLHGCAFVQNCLKNAGVESFTTCLTTHALLSLRQELFVQETRQEK